MVLCWYDVTYALTWQYSVKEKNIEISRLLMRSHEIYSESEVTFRAYNKITLTQQKKDVN